jgi:hypothetical protein
MEDERVLRNLRSMAWERAKGELKSMLHTFFGEEDQFNRLDNEITMFIARVEDNGLSD